MTLTLTLDQFQRWLQGQIAMGINLDREADYIERFARQMLVRDGDVAEIRVAPVGITIRYLRKSQRNRDYHQIDPLLRKLVTLTPSTATVRELLFAIDEILGILSDG